MENDSDFIIGELVYIPKFKCFATIVNFKKNNIVRLSLKNDLIISLLISEISRTRSKINKVCIQNNFDENFYFREKKLFSNFHTEVDLHGYRAKEAIEYLEQLLDRALYYGESEVVIIHGKGSGTLRQVVKNFIKTKNFLSLSKVPSNICENSAICVKIYTK